jgi:ATP-dependent DNA helicase RecG
VSEQPLREGEKVELKERWDHRALESAAAFANCQGGSVWLGIRDEGKVIGFDPDDGEVQRIANQVSDVLGIRPAITRRTHQGRPVLEVRVEPAVGLVACKGRYLTRVGSTNQDLTLDQMARLILERFGRTWDGLPAPETFVRIDDGAVREFIRLARSRLPQLREDEPAERVLANLSLLSEGRPTNAALLLFGERPQHVFRQAQVRIGRFQGWQVIEDATAAGGLIAQLFVTLEVFGRYLHVRYEIPTSGTGIEALQRREIWDYPLDALREAVINALIHRDYTAVGDIQIRVYEDRLEIWNPGRLPPELTPAKLREDGHLSKPRNPLLAQVFYYTSLIERWGTGTTRMIAACRGQGLPEPEFVEDSGGLKVIFRKDVFTRERLHALGLNERQAQAVLHVRDKGSLSNSEYQALTGASKPTATRDLDDLVQRGILRRSGQRGRGTRYTLIGS